MKQQLTETKLWHNPNEKPPIGHELLVHVLYGENEYTESVYYHENTEEFIGNYNSYNKEEIIRWCKVSDILRIE